MTSRDHSDSFPEHLNQMLRGFMPSRCLLTALELDVFTAAGEGAGADEIAGRIHGDARAVGILLDALVALGLLSKTGPTQAALLSVNMLVGTEGGASYNEREYTEWMREAGFAPVERIRLQGPADLMVGSAG